jgi:glucose-1-phosphate cytidylyltransferase
MKAVILAGGYGTRISEESTIRPKPMVEIGGKPILWHIMKIYSSHGINDFVICCGYKAYMIKEYFANYFIYNADITFDMRYNSMQIHHNTTEPWNVTVIDTGDKTMTGGRIKRVRKYIGNETFCLTYGDGVANVDITKLVEYHRQQHVLGTVTAVQPPGRFGAFTLQDDNPLVNNFREKPKSDGGEAWISGGFFVLEPKVIDLIAGDDTVWEQEPMEELVGKNQMAAYRHEGFWQPMDTLRDKNMLEDLWQSGKAPWKVW